MNTILARKIRLSLLFGVVFAAGAFVLYLVTIHPYISIMNARSWDEKSCRIISSEVITLRSNEGDSYLPEINYEYSVNDQLLQSKRYDFTTGYSNDYLSKKKIVDRYPAGSRSICFVNPANSNDAVLNRSLNSNIPRGLFALIFVFVGLGGWYFTWKSKPEALPR